MIIFRNYLSLLINSIKVDWFCLLHFYIALVIIPCISFWGYPDSFLILEAGLIETFLFFLVAAVFSNNIRRVLFIISLLLLSVNLCLDLGNFLANGNLFNPSSFQLVLGTNQQESIEFFQTYLSLKKIIVLILALLLFVASIFFSIRLRKQLPTACAKVLLSLFSIIVILLVPNVINHKSIYASIFPGNWGFIITKYEPCSDLRKYSHIIQLDEVDSNHPEKIVVIIGESFSKGHSSLYGYDKQTNPRLELLRRQGNLFVFNNVESPDYTTGPCFKQILSTYNGSSDSIWYQCITLNDIFGNVYTTNWVSNQSSTGAYDNVQYLYAQLCDSIWYSDKEFCNKTFYDEVVIDALKGINLLQDGVKTFTIINLMGQHESYRSRFPVSFSRFTPSQYPNKLETQRTTLADYDNSILYNDSIISEIFTMYESEDALLFYFSDHGMDIFDTDDKYHGHARHNDPSSVMVSKKIPFFVYATDVYKSNHPNELFRIQSSTDVCFNTSNLIYSLLDISGWSFDCTRVESMFYAPKFNSSIE